MKLKPETFGEWVAKLWRAAEEGDVETFDKAMAEIQKARPDIKPQPDRPGHTPWNQVGASIEVA